MLVLLFCSSAALLLLWAFAASFIQCMSALQARIALSVLVHSGTAYLASQACDWAAAFWDSLSGLQLFNL